MSGPYDRTYGVELETISFGGLNRAQAARKLCDAGIPAFDAGYSHTLSDKWKLVSDNSLTEGRRGPGIEFVSPILHGEEGFATIAKVCDVLRQNKFDVDKSCGLHVHVDVRRPTPLDLPASRRLAMLYTESEEILDTVMPPSRRKSACNFAQSLLHPNINEHLSVAEDATAIARLLHGNVPNRFGRVTRSTDMLQWKFVKLNFCTSWKYGTVEFRHHAGTIDETKICNWSLACMRMVDYAANAVTTEEVLETTRRTQRIFASVRRGTKREIIYHMLLRPEGVTLQEALAATGWRQASMANIGHSYGMSLRQQRERIINSATGLSVLTTRYWGTLTDTPQILTPRAGATILPGRKPTNLDEFADRIGMSLVEKEFWHQRAAIFAQSSADMMAGGAQLQYPAQTVRMGG